MKTINDKLSPEKAKSELVRFAKLGLFISLAGLFLGFLGAVSLAFSGRAMVLAQKDSNKNDKQLSKYKTMAYAGFAVSIVDLFFVFYQ